MNMVLCLCYCLYEFFRRVGPASNQSPKQMCLWLLGRGRPGFCDRRCASGSLCSLSKDLLGSLVLMGQPCGPFLSHLSALLLLSLLPTVGF